MRQDNSYLAGFFDGEGSVSICGRTYFQIMAQISNTNIGVLKLYQRRFKILLPFLIIKKDQANLALAFQKRLVRKPITRQEKEIREKMKKKMQFLNKSRFIK